MASKRIDDIVEAVIKINLLTDKGELPAWSSKSWQRVADILNTAIKFDKKILTRDYVYTLVKNDRYGILTKVKSSLGIEVGTLPENNVFESEQLESLEKEDSENEDIINDHGKYTYFILNKIEFCILLSTYYIIIYQVRFFFLNIIIQ